MIQCPYHLGDFEPTFEQRDNSKVYVCKHKDCGAEIHRDFVEQRKIPRATVGLVGFSGHGKTVYTTSLFYLLKFLRTEWEDYFCLSLDKQTHESLYNQVEQFKNSRLPASTPVQFPSPLIMSFSDIPFYGNWFLSFYDIGGGVFEEEERITNQGRLVAYSDIVLFVISIDDSCNKDYQKDWSSSIEALLETYSRAVFNRMRIDLKNKQHLIVVLTKGDDLEKVLSSDLKKELIAGSYKDYLNFDKYDRIALKERSRLIKDWLLIKGCGGFINIAKAKFKSVEYTLVSSTGAAPVGDRLATKLTPEDPKRVLDPFFWTLEKCRPSRWKLWG